jgi:hypothetical protein
MTRTKLVEQVVGQAERLVLMVAGVEHSLPVVQDLREQITALPYKVLLLTVVTKAEAEVEVAVTLAVALVTVLQDTPAVEVLVTLTQHQFHQQF